MDTIVFEITWDGSQDARLYYLIDNDEVMTTTSSLAPMTSQVTVGRGRIEVTYRRAADAVHRIEWSLMFPGKTLSNLVATVKVNGNPKKTKPAGDDQKQHWISEMNA